MYDVATHSSLSTYEYKVTVHGDALLPQIEWLTCDAATHSSLSIYEVTVDGDASLPQIELLTCGMATKSSLSIYKVTYSRWQRFVVHATMCKYLKLLYFLANARND